jgi:hypothetical protein
MASTERQQNLLVNEDWTKIYQTFQNADFKSYDFETIKRSMIEYLRQNYPENFNDYIDSSEYIALIDMIAFLAQSLSFRIDLNSRENFIDTAERKESILRLAKLISYNPKRNQTSNGFLKVTSVSTTENLIDSNGTNLSNKLVIWNDGTNPDWYQQFNYIMNAAMSTAIFGKPNSRATINGIPTEQYEISTITDDVPIFTFTKTVGGVPMTFELVGTRISEDQFLVEQNPKVGDTFGVLYKNDNKGSASKNSGWFLQFKEGILQSSDFSITNPIANEIIGVDIENINDTDVWLYEVDSSNRLSTLWSKLESTTGNNVIYNSLKNKVKTFYSVSTRDNDQIDLHFSDGIFGKLPIGNFRLYYRTSNGLGYSISPQDMSNVQVRIPYLSRNNQTQTITVTLNLQSTVSNSSPTETTASIKEKAPQLYYTQNRMITAEDYNIYPLVSSQDIVKIKSINRVSSGISRFFELNDPTGRSSNVNLFADDGALYKNQYKNSFIFNFNTKNEIYGFVKSKLEPLLSAMSTRDFYYEIFSRVDSDLVNVSWKNVHSFSNQSTGFFRNENTNSAVPVGQFTQSTLRYIKPEALIKFVPPSGKYFAPNNTITSVKTKNTKDYIWAELIYVTGDGSNLGSGVDEFGAGLVGISMQIPDGAIPSQIIPVFVTDIPFTFETEIVNQMFLRRDFGIRYDKDASEWRIVISSNLDIVNQFSLTYSGDASNLQLDSSWIIAFKSDGENYIVYYRGLEYIFQSAKQINFYFNEEDKKYDSKLGGYSKDNIKILSVNSNVITGSPLGNDFIFEVAGMISNQDGYKDNNRLKISFSDRTGDGIADDPDSFSRIVEPEYIDPISNTKTSFVYLQSNEINGQIYQTVLDDSLIIPVEREISLTNLTVYDQGQLFYFYASDENVVKRLTSSLDLELEPGIKAYPGRNNIKFQYEHIASKDFRIDPAKTNIIDIYLLTKTYDNTIRAWINSGEGARPMPPSSTELYQQFFNSLNTVKSISDELVFHPVKYKLLFGSDAELDLQAQFYIVKNPSSVANDNDIKSRVIQSINQYFNLENWDFGDTFNFGELSAFVIRNLSPDIVNFLIVPKAPEKYFGSLFQVFCEPDEIFLSTAGVEDIEIINTVTSGLLKVNGPIVVSSSLLNG